MDEEPGLIKVASNSRSTSVAGAVAGMIRDGRLVAIQAIGAGAVNQAVKACAIARSYLQEDGIDIMLVPSFVEIDIESSERTAVRLEVMRRE